MENFNKKWWKKGRITDWTPEQMAKLYSGTIKDVAAALGKTYGMVYTKRKKYEEENPTFVVPDCAIAQRVASVASETTYKEIVAELTNEEVRLLWNNSSAELRKNYPGIFKSIFAIFDMRIEYCKLNPDFVIPLAAKFSSASKGLKNPVEQKQKKEKPKLTSGLTDDEMSVIWDASGKEVAALLNTHYNAIYHARIAYCKANPDFVIPAISGFKRPSDVTNAVEVITPATTENTQTVAEEIVVEPVTPIVEVSKQPAAQPVVEKLTPEIAKIEVTQPVVVAQPASQNTMSEMFALLTASGMKPKKATFKDGEVSFEF